MQTITFYEDIFGYSQLHAIVLGKNHSIQYLLSEVHLDLHCLNIYGNI